MRNTALPLTIACFSLALANAAWAQAHTSPAAPAGALRKATTTITGRLAQVGLAPIGPAQQEGSAVLKVKDRSYQLTAQDEDARLTLADARLSGRELQLEGKWKGTDTFEVDRLFTVRNGKLYKVTYFCETCNITTYKPGICDCCQQPTALREVPYDPQGIY